MITINISGFLSEFTDGRRQLTVDALPGTVGEALAKLWESHEGLRDRILNEQGQVRPHVNIFLNSENIKHKQLLDSVLSEKDEITILPAVSGGSAELP